MQNLLAQNFHTISPVCTSSICDYSVSAVWTNSVSCTWCFASTCTRCFCRSGDRPPCSCRKTPSRDPPRNQIMMTSSSCNPQCRLSIGTTPVCHTWPRLSLGLRDLDPISEISHTKKKKRSIKRWNFTKRYRNSKKKHVWQVYFYQYRNDLMTSNRGV